MTRHLRCALAILVVLLAQPVLAHFDKPFDRNGGHWDDSGNYHCHDTGCTPTESRYQFRLNRLSNRHDMDLYYLEEDWPHWLAYSGCKTARTVVLENTSQIQVTWTNPRQCEIREGLWTDEYTGKQYKRAAELEIDHVISPQYANSANGYQWDAGKRSAFANDINNLIPVARATYRKKRQRGISSWRPQEDFQCEYAQIWQAIANRYDLDLFATDTSRINTILKGCTALDSTGVKESP